MILNAVRCLLFVIVALAVSACGSSGGGGGGGSSILGLTLSTDGNTLYLANADKHVIQSVNLATLAVSTYAGGANASGTTNGTGAAARFYGPFALVNVGGTLFVADTFNHGIRQIDATQTVTTLAGKLGTAGATDDTGVAALFNYPKGITSGGGDFYVADTSNFLIRKVTSGGAVTTFAGTSGQPGYVDGASTAGVKFGVPFAVAATATNIYLSDSSNHSIRSILIADKSVSTLAGSTSGVSGTTDSTGTSARFNAPAGIVTDGTNLYVADSDNHTIRKIVIATGVVSTIAGTAGTSGLTDSPTGPGTAAKFNTPIGLALDTTRGFLYVSDQRYTKIRKIDLASGAVTTLNASF